MDDDIYLEKVKEKLVIYEALCLHCGACCGALDGDPCGNLVKDERNKYYCKDYSNRLGLQLTVSGKSFNCVPIRDTLKFEPSYPFCAYAKK